MAGSYRHCCNDDGSFTFDLIENMGDAREACEDMHGIIGKALESLELARYTIESIVRAHRNEDWIDLETIAAVALTRARAVLAQAEWGE